HSECIRVGTVAQGHVRGERPAPLVARLPDEAQEEAIHDQARVHDSHHSTASGSSGGQRGRGGPGPSPPPPGPGPPAPRRTPPPYCGDESKLPSDAVPGTTTARYWGVHGGAGYRIEVPAKWNGELVLYAHGFRGTGLELSITNPRIRQFLVTHGYAWGASSFA